MDYPLLTGNRSEHIWNEHLDQVLIEEVVNTSDKLLNERTLAHQVQFCSEHTVKYSKYRTVQ